MGFLLGPAPVGGGSLLGELERIEELVADAQVALEAGSPASRSALRRLVVEMEDFVAALFLDDSAGSRSSCAGASMVASTDPRSDLRVTPL